MDEDAKALLSLLVCVGLFLWFAVWAINRDYAREHAHCRALGGTPVVLYGQDTCWPGGVTK